MVGHRERERARARASLVAQTVKNLPVMQETWVLSLHQKYPLEEGIPTPVFLPGIPWTEEPGGLLSTEIGRAHV